MKMEVFVPMKWHLVTRKGMRIREKVPFIQDLLFVHETQNNLDAVVEKIPTLQYRWLRGTWREPMTVADTDMERFIRAVDATESPVLPAGRNYPGAGAATNPIQQTETKKHSEKISKKP